MELTGRLDAPAGLGLGDPQPVGQRRAQLQKTPIWCH
jgi:hypothetical protein